MRWLDSISGAAFFLSSALIRPHAEELVESLAQPGLLDDWPIHNVETAAGLECWAVASAAPDSADDYLADYTQLFLGPGLAQVWPYESVQLSQDRLVFERETLAVRAAYAEFGLSAPSLNREPDDHIALELHFVSLLAQRAVAAGTAGDEAEALRCEQALTDFSREHLLVWGDLVAEALINHSQTTFYRGTGHVLRGFLTELREGVR